MQHSTGGGLLVTELWRYSLCVHVRSCRIRHAVKGEALYAYVTLVEDVQPSAKLHAELVHIVKTQIGSFATPDVTQWAPGLPNKCSGKVIADSCVILPQIS